MQLFLVVITLAGFLLDVTAPVNGVTCTNPSVRKEWRALSTSERAEWISAVNCLSKLPHDDAFTASVDPTLSIIPPLNTSGSYYDDFVYMHMDLNIEIHFTGLFLPWHRWYVAVYEKVLSEKCGFTGTQPYWNWSLDSAAPNDSPLFQDSNTESGLGGWGDPSLDFTVTDGGFSDLQLSYPSPHILRRNWTAQPWLVDAGSDFFTDPEKYAGEAISPSEVNKMVTGFSGNFTGFQAYFEGWEGAHGAVHLMMGGDMGGTCPANAPSNCTGGPKWSANEPMFWMHHAMVDKVWYDWQHYNSDNFGAFFGGSVEKIDTLADYDQFPNGGPPFLSLNSTMPADGLFPEATIGSVMNTTGGFLCYIYE